MFEIEVSNSGKEFIQLHITIRNVQIGEDWELEVVLYLHEGTKGEREYSRNRFLPPLDEYLRLGPLPSGSMFKVAAMLSNGAKSIKSTVYTFTKAKDEDPTDSTGSEVELQGRQSRNELPFDMPEP